MTYLNSVSPKFNFETAGSLGYAKSETTGSIANSGCVDDSIPQIQQLDNDTVNFRGRQQYDEYGDPIEKKKKSPLLVGGLVAATAAAVIIGLGYTHKTDVIAKMSDGKIKDILSKLNPVTERCHSWCSWTKGKGTDMYNTIKGWISKK